MSGDKDLEARLIKRFQPLFGEESNLIPVPDHVDRTVFSTVPLEIYILTKEQKYLDLGKPGRQAMGEPHSRRAELRRPATGSTICTCS